MTRRYNSCQKQMYYASWVLLLSSLMMVALAVPEPQTDSEVVATTTRIPLNPDPHPPEPASPGNSTSISAAEIEALANELLFARRNLAANYTHRNVSFDYNDFNKEVVDYDSEYLDSLYFIETEKAAGNETAARAAVETLLAKHHDNQEMYQYMLELSQRYPEVCRLYDIGQSSHGRKLWVLEITEEPGKAQAHKPEFRFIGNMHGNEVVGREMLLHLARLLVENYRASKDEPFVNDKRPTGPKFVRKLLAQTRIHLMPTMNPDGYENSKEGCVYERISKRGRINDKNIDLNRNFPDRVLGNKPDAGTQPEVRAIMDWSRSVGFVLSANLHGGALVASYGYDGNNRGDSTPEYTAAPDDDVLRHLASTYARNHPLMARNEICYDECAHYHPEVFPDGTTNGAGWYPLYGGMQDWVYENTNALEITLELGCNQYPKASELPKYWAFNKRSLLAYMQQVHRGIRGIVRDATSKAPLANVTVRVHNRQHDTKTGRLGEFHRILLPGNYEVSFEKAGYSSQKVATVAGGIAAKYDIYLHPVGGSQQSDSSSEPSVEQVITEHLQPSELNKPEDSQHSLVVATLVMTIIITLILIAMVGAFVIQRRRFSRSQSVSMELQPARSGRSAGTASTGISLAGQQPQQQKLPPASGSSTNLHLSA